MNHHPGNELNVCSDPDIGDTPEKNLIREKHRDTDLFTDNEGDKYVGTRKKYLHQTLGMIFVCVCSKLPFDNHGSDTTAPTLHLCIKVGASKRWERGEFETIQLSVGLILN